MKKALLTYLAILRAGAALGRCSRQKRQGRLQEALASARRGLDALRPHLSHEMTNGSQALLTVEVESLAFRLGAPGASTEDLKDTIRFLKREEADGVDPEYLAWVPYLEERLIRQGEA